MARNDLIVDLIRAGASGDGEMLRATVEAMAAEERARKNETLASKLTRALGASGHINPARRISALPAPGRELLAEVVPKVTLADLVLTSATRNGIEQLIEEQLRGDLLRSHGLQPRHRVLLCGPPGNGKTALAEAISDAVGVPYFTVRYEALIGSFLGETAQRLGQLFAFARTTPCVLFFDEFDVVGKERGDAHETGEIKRVVSNLLLQIDALPSHVVAVAATNHSELLDTAVWRRFQLRLALPSPTPDDLATFFGRALAGFVEHPQVDVPSLVERIGPVSYAEASEFLLDVRRRTVLAQGKRPSGLIVEELTAQWAARARPAGHGKRSNKASTEARPAEPRAAAAGRAKQEPAAHGVPAPKTKRPARPKVPAPARHPRSKTGPGRAKA